MGMYHASMTQATKASVQADFSGNSSLRVLVATVAYGMVNIANIVLKSYLFQHLEIMFRGWTSLMLVL